MSTHHAVAGFCPLCREKGMTLHPVLLQWWDQIKAHFPQAHISWGWRGEKDQNFAYHEGRSRVTWPHSRHNIQTREHKPCSEAMDLFLLRLDNVAAFPMTFYEQVAQFLKQKGAPMEWGHDLWQWDTNHFQLKRPIGGFQDGFAG